MILVIDAINKDKFTHVLDDMFKLRARVFGDRLGWQVEVKDGRERDVFDDLDPAYAVGLDGEGNVVSCVRALQTTGPHMLSDVFSDILNGEPPLRSATLWESTRFCVDTKRLGRGRDRNSVSYATCELMIASLEAAKNAGVSDIVTVIDPVMDRVLKRSGNAPYDYVGKVADMGKVPALAALLDCTDERINRIRAFSGIEDDVFMTDEHALSLPVIARTSENRVDILEYCNEQVASATTDHEIRAAKALRAALAHMVRSRSDMRA
ncbi:MAG: acyl-homoserine-lactone synthase [Roseovarius sp.]|nr:acyl-homoserine-lactone synthase [Roseovarius sp.]